ncbi:MAG: nucleotidyltransferase family protein [Ruminococcus sp.]|nr:nucleotidyltransferase family protein [Ruminococcus sp.]
MKHKIGCVILASGKSERYGNNKLDIKIDGVSLIDRAISCIPKNSFSKVAVVSRFENVKEKTENRGFHYIENNHPEYGISHTIKLGLNYTSDCDATLFMVSDQPLLKQESVVKMLEFFSKNSDFIVSMGYNGKKGNPCIFPKAFYDELFALENDNGGSAVIKYHEDKLKIFNIECKKELKDIDTKEDLEFLSETEV